MFRLQPQVKNYLWGQTGINSLVGQLINVDDHDNQPYAELWMGTHTNGMSIVKAPVPKSLEQWLLDNNLNDLPFLFKILSIDKALSIQAHPDKQLAEQLFKTNPEHYKDDNHKPEMCIALTKFEALCKFRPLHEIRKYLETIGPFKQLFDEQTVQAFLQNPSKVTLKALFTEWISLNDVTQAINALTPLDEATKLVLRLAGQYPGDFGVFAPYFLNYVVLKPGDAIFIGANEPHAYISGDCVECMAKSDNVVRAGLTSKYIDTETLCNMLTYNCDPIKLVDTITSECTIDYISPTPEFKITNIMLRNDVKKWYSLNVQLLIVIDGHLCIQCDEQELQLKMGDVIVILPEKNITLSSDEDVNVFIAY